MGVIGSITYNGELIVDFSEKSSGILTCAGKTMTTDIAYTIGQSSCTVTLVGNGGYTITATGGGLTETVTISGTDAEKNTGTLIITPTSDGEVWTFTNGWNLLSSIAAITGGTAITVDLYTNPIFGPGGEDYVLSSTATYDGSETALTTLSYKSLTITAAGSITMTGRNAGLVIRTTGDCTILGTITNNYAPRILSSEESLILSATYPYWMLNSIAGAGGAGSSSGMSGRYYGGGYGGGGAGDTSLYGAGGGSAANISTSTSSIFVGGSGGTCGTNKAAGVLAWGNGGVNGGGGGGGSYCYAWNSAWSAAHGGDGGSGGGGNAGGTWGQAGGWMGQWYAGGGGGAGNYGGGVIIIYCGGNLTIEGTIDVKGGNGGAASAGFGSNAGTAGGGGGGGRIYIVYKNAFNMTGTYNISGGSGAGTSTAGTYYAEQITT